MNKRPCCEFTRLRRIRAAVLRKKSLYHRSWLTTPILIGASIALGLLWPAFKAAAAENTGYSPLLAEITADNVAQLKPVFSFTLPVRRRVCGDTADRQPYTLFVLTPFPHTLYALEASGDAAGSVKWRYSPEANPAAASLRSSLPGSAWARRGGGCRLFQYARRAYDLARCRERPGQMGPANRRFFRRRDAWFGAAGGRESRSSLATRETITARAAGSRRSTAIPARSCGANTAPAPTAMSALVLPFSRSMERTRGNGSRRGSWPPDAWQHGGGTVSGRCPMMAVSTRSSTAPATRRRATRSSAQATIDGPPDCSRATAQPGWPVGLPR